MRRRGNRHTTIVLEPTPDNSPLRDALRDDFVANLSHELKSPVGALIVIGEAMRAEDDPDAIRRLAERVLTESERMSTLLEDLLEFGRNGLEAWIDHRRVGVRDVIADAMDRVRLVAHSRDIRLEINEGPSHLNIFGSRRQLSSALGNLLENGVKYSKEHGRVSLRVERRAGWIELSVTDDGIGIPAEDLERVFERFYRGTSARAFEGNGLGLAIVRQVASEHGGEISVTSAAGVGSTFILRLPLAAGTKMADATGSARRSR